MKYYKIEYYSNDVQEQIYNLPNTLRACYIRQVELMIESGANLGMPYTKHIGDNLFELRLKGKEGIARVMYCTLIGRKIIMLHSFIKKTQKIPDKELKIARKRMKEVKYET